MLDKLQAIHERYVYLEEQLSDPSVISDMDRYKKVSNLFSFFGILRIYPNIRWIDNLLLVILHEIPTRSILQGYMIMRYSGIFFSFLFGQLDGIKFEKTCFFCIHFFQFSFDFKTLEVK